MQIFCFIVFIIVLILWIKNDYNVVKDQYTQYKHPHTWFIDIDGVIFEHNGLMEKGYDTPIEGVVEFLENLPNDDIIILTTARSDNVKDKTLQSLNKHGIRYNQVLFNMNIGKRILINDKKPDGMHTAFSFNLERNEKNGLKNNCKIN